MLMTEEGKRAREIGKRIKLARKEAGGMTQRELANAVGVTERSVVSYERGQVVPYRMMDKIAEVTRKQSTWLLYGDEDASLDPELFLEELKALRREVLLLRREFEEQQLGK